VLFQFCGPQLLSQFSLQALKAAAHSTNMPSHIDYQPGDNGLLLLTSSPGLGYNSSEVPNSPVYTTPVNFGPQVVPQFQIGLSKSLGAAQPAPSPFYGCYSLPDVTVTPQHVPRPVRDVPPAAKRTIDTKLVLPPTKTVSQTIV
jgi:hypothetical protein